MIHVIEFMFGEQAAEEFTIGDRADFEFGARGDLVRESARKIVEHNHFVSERERVAGHMTPHEARAAGYERPWSINCRISHTYGVNTLSCLS
jgi:hypothetical protein